MTGNEYQKEALRTASGMNYEHHGMLINGVLGLCGEAGEVADIVKKATFQGHELDTKHIAEELGDCAWYLAIAAAAIGMELDDVFEMNKAKLRERYPDGFSHEIVRHRLASYCQESTRYCNYSKDDFQSEITVIEPSFLDKSAAGYRIWERSCKNAETAYFDLLDFGCSPQEARAVLPNSLKTEIVMTADLREWRHFLKLRTSQAAHPQIREVAIPLLNELKSLIPVIFDDIEV